MTTITANVPLLGGVYDIAIEGQKFCRVSPSDACTDLHAGPTLFDIQVNGFGGRTCSLASAEKKDGLAYIGRIMREVGVGWWIPTITTAGRDALENAFRYCGEALDEDPDTAASIPGLHLEGPYISPRDGPRGAHQSEHVRPPDWTEFQRLQELCGGRILYVTLSPESEGAMDFIRKCVGSGVVVSIGHSDLDRDTLARAVDAGATMSTHLGNGAHDMIQRHNNYIWYQLACRQTYASFIADGHHLPRECLYSMVRAKGLDLSIVTSDCMELGGLKPGVYEFSSGSVEKLPSGRVNAVGSPNLAGSADHLLHCVNMVIRMAKLSQAEGWRLGSLQPANMLGLGDRLGLEPGKEASLTLYRLVEPDDRIEVVETWVAGKKVFDAAVTPRVTMPDHLLDVS